MITIIYEEQWMTLLSALALTDTKKMKMTVLFGMKGNETLT